VSRGRDLPTTTRAAKGTFAIQKAHASWALERGRNHDESEPANMGELPPLRAGIMDSGKECQPDGWLWKGAEKMTTEHQRTPEEEGFNRLLDEKWNLLSEDARELVGLAQLEAYKDNLVHNCDCHPLEYSMCMEDMVRLAGELGDQEREFIAEVGRAATAAAAALDPEDKRPAGHKVCMGDVHRFYDMVSGMIEEALEPKTDREREEARRGLWMGYADFEVRLERNSAQAEEQVSGQVPHDPDDIPF
jgi:hypothetical protein